MPHTARYLSQGQNQAYRSVTQNSLSGRDWRSKDLTSSSFRLLSCPVPASPSQNQQKPQGGSRPKPEAFGHPTNRWSDAIIQNSLSRRDWSFSQLPKLSSFRLLSCPISLTFWEGLQLLAAYEVECLERCAVTETCKSQGRIRHTEAFGHQHPDNRRRNSLPGRDWSS